MFAKSSRPVQHIPSATLRADIELTPERVEYVDIDKVLMSMKTKTGDVVIYTMSTAGLIHLTNMSVALINGFTAQVLRDLGAL
jgi:hypothetical protein